MNLESLFKLDFICARENFKHLNSEKKIVEIQKKKLLSQLLNIESELKNATSEQLFQLYNILKEKHYRALISPGECVGIAGAQSMGEFSTQATLNTFHVAGLDSGVTTGVARFQDIINASKNQKDIRCIIYFKNVVFKNNEELKTFLNYSFVQLKFNDILSNSYFMPDNFKEHWYLPCFYMFLKKEAVFPEKYCVLRYELNKKILYKYFLHPYVIREKFELLYPNGIYIFSPLSRRGKIYFDILFSIEEKENIYNIIKPLESAKISGIENVKNYITRYENNEWFIETEGGKLLDFFENYYVDSDRSKTNSMWDIYETFGIEAVRQFLLEELTKNLYGVNIHNISLLVEKMTFTGTIASITRYSMRNEEEPLGIASFEQSMETFFNAGKYGKVDQFSGNSATIIGGKKPRIGTNFFDIKIDFDKLNGN
jgi:DNA-directed RNA polymerase subunit A"